MLQPLSEVFAHCCSMNKQPESCAARLQCSALTCYNLKACMAGELCNAQSPRHGVSALLLQALVLKAGPWRLILARAWRPWLLALCHLQQCHVHAAREGRGVEGRGCLCSCHRTEQGDPGAPEQHNMGACTYLQAHEQFQRQSHA